MAKQTLSVGNTITALVGLDWIEVLIEGSLQAFKNDFL